MGILESLAGWKRILQYAIAFGGDKDVSVHVIPSVSKLPGPEYIRLWASYEAKIIYNLGFPSNMHAVLALDSVTQLIGKPIAPDTDCFARVELSVAMRFVRDVPATRTQFTGEFYAKGSLPEW